MQVIELVERVIEKRLTYLAPQKLSLLIETIEKINLENIPGDFAEFGIALGGSAICIASKLTGSRKFYGFDNFDLIPAPEPVDGERPNSRYQVIKAGESSGIGGDLYYGYEKDRLAVVTRNFEEFGLQVDGKRIILIKGLFEETLPIFLNGPVAFAHLDCDWYSPIKLCLERIYPLLSEGGAILIDDYNYWEGCTKATDEFCAAFPQMSLVPGPGNAILIKQFA